MGYRISEYNKFQYMSRGSRNNPSLLFYWKKNSGLSIILKIYEGFLFSL
jgi:hypothetical protein